REAGRARYARSARSTAARMTSRGAARSGKKRLKAAAPWCTSTSRPSCARTPAARSVRTQRVPPGAYTRSSAAARRRARSGSRGSGSASLRPSGVALIATSGWSAPRAGSARAPLPRAQSVNPRARAASRDTTCRSALAVAAATATARAAPPVPTNSQLPPPSAPSCRSALRIPATSVLSPTSRRVSALTSTRELFDDALHGRLDESFELGTGVAVHVQVAAERIADLRFVTLSSGVLAQHEHATLAAELVHPRPVVPRHGEDQVGAFDQLPRQEARAVAREVEPPFEPDQVGPLGDGRTVPRSGAGGRHGETLAAPLRERA